MSASLNNTLARLNSIENSFQALDGVAFSMQDNSLKVEQKPYFNSEFKKILDEKMGDKKITPEKKAQEELKEVDEVLKTVENEEITPEEKEAVNLKSKINLASQNADVEEIIETFASKYDIDSYFIKAIIKQESGFNVNAKSKKGAMGLMQLMPATAKSLGVSDAFNPWENIEGGVKHLRGLLNKYDNNPELALAAYNAGSGAVKKYGGIPPYKETQNYVKSIMSMYNKVKEAKI